MNIEKKNIDDLNLALKIQVEKADYEPRVKKSLNDFRRKAVIDGFRPGMAPAGLIEKKYGKSVFFEEINKIVSESLSNYITEEKLNLIGEPIPYEAEQKEIDWDNDTTFEFAYEMGVAPEVNITLSDKDVVPYYNITITDEDKQKQAENYQYRYGKMEPAEIAADDDLLKVNFNQEGEDGMQINDTYISLRTLDTPEKKDLFLGKKAGDAVEVNVNEVFTNEADRAAMLKVTKEELPNLNPLFTVTITEVQHFNKAELNQELFDMAFGAGNVKDEKEFDEKITAEITQSFKENADYRFEIDARDYLLKKADLKLPETFLKRWLFVINEGKFTMEEIDKDFDNFVLNLKWQLIKEYFVKTFDLKVENADMLGYAMKMAKHQFMQYGLYQLGDEYLQEYAYKILEQKEQAKQIYDRLLDEKVVDYVKSAVSLENKEISKEEFQKLPA